MVVAKQGTPDSGVGFDLSLKRQLWLQQAKTEVQAFKAEGTA